MKFLLPITIALSFASTAFAGGADFIASSQVDFQSSNPEATLQATASGLRDVFERFEPATDSGMTITSAKQVSGPAAAPIVTFSVQKCVFVVCQSADIFAEVTMRPSARQSTCTKNYALVADLHRSSATMADVYSSLNVNICYTKTATGGHLAFSTSAVHAPNYNGGIVQQQIFGVLKLQTSPILSAISETLNANSK